MTFRWWFFPILALAALALSTALIVGYAAAIVYPTLPSLESLTDYNPKIPLRIYGAEGGLIGEFGEERRALVRIADVPESLRLAILAAEDERFYQHGGVDLIGVARAMLHNFVPGGSRQGASTITMQVARNFFLTKEKTFTRKFNEALLSLKIERSLSKDQILELYVNQIYLGQRSYGFAAAAQAYFGKNLRNLDVAEAAMLAGLPKAPSNSNPVINPRAAKRRQAYVLKRMHELRYITDEQYARAQATPLHVRRDQPEAAAHADYVAEMVRQAMYARYKEDTYTKGFKVYTTLSQPLQEAAYAAVRKGLLDYDRRHGYRGAEATYEIPEGGSEEAFEALLQEQSDSDDIYPALVLEASPREVKAYRQGGEQVTIGPEGLKFARNMLGERAAAGKRLVRGALVRIQRDEKGAWQIVQLPQVEGALVSINPADGGIRALVGGFDFSRNKFNHATQGLRQPGSSFKPFVYSAALEKGFTPATVINDAPLTIDASETGSAAWEPKNYEGTYDGPIRMRTALTKSKNLVSVRILRAITPAYAQDYITRFGFDPKQHPPYLTMALGAGSVTVQEMSLAYTVFANGGYRLSPYYIARVEDAAGRKLFQAASASAGDESLRVIDPRNAYLMTSMMRDVIRSGTGAKAMSLGRSDLAGKTGTTNEQMDAWFAGFQHRLATVVWVGFDLPRTLGGAETGAAAALPIWISYMGVALKDVPEELPVLPDGVAVVPIDPATGRRVPAGTAGAIPEVFYREGIPGEGGEAGGAPGGRKLDDTRNELY